MKTAYFLLEAILLLTSACEAITGKEIARINIKEDGLLQGERGR
jgi:hypothetical protein